MRIGAAFNFPQLPQRQAALPKPTPAVQDDSQSENSKPQALQAIFERLADFGAAGAGQADSAERAGSERFYSTERQLPLQGRVAVDTYLTNASLSQGASQAEWVGVDTYA